MNKEKHIRFDWAIKRLLRQKANFVILEGFLSELLFDDIKIQEIIESEGNKEEALDKFNRVDILVKDKNDDLILIEVQNEKQDDYFHRMNYAQAKLISEHIHAGDEYNKICFSNTCRAYTVCCFAYLYKNVYICSINSLQKFIAVPR